MAGSPSSSRSSPADLARLAAVVGDQHVDLCIDVRRRLTGERLLVVGGVWDRVGKRYAPPRLCKTLLVNESQVVAMAAIASWIAARAAGKKRLVEIILEGARGSGKTHLGVLAVWFIAIAFPGARCWLVSPANTRRAELAQIVLDHIPLDWRSAWSERDYKYTLPNGSTITYIGADDEDALKQGGYEVCLLNEMQLITSTAFAAAAGGVRNVSGRPTGLLIGAMNYASKVRGEWTEDHLDKIEAGGLNAQRFIMDPHLNASIESEVVDDTEAIVRSARPDLADRDSLGIRRRIGEKAAPAFKPLPVEKGGHVGVPPDLGWFDETAHLTSKKTGRERGYTALVGADFQSRPHCCGLAVRVYRRADGKHVYHPFDVILANGNEDDLAERIIDREHDPRHVLVVADSSGKWQNTARIRNGKYSHDILREYGFTVAVPQRSKNPNTPTAVGRNPDVDDSLAQLFDVCDEERLLVHPSCEWLIESLYRCKVKRYSGRMRLDDSDPGYSHILDCLRYVIWYCEPKRGPQRKPVETTKRAGGVMPRRI